MQPVLASSVTLRGGQRRCPPATRYCLVLPLGGVVEKVTRVIEEKLRTGVHA